MLKKSLGEAKVRIDNQTCQDHAGDKSYLPPVVPQCVVIPETNADIKTVLEFANTYRIPVTVRGGGSGKSGGAIPEKGGIALSMEKFNAILETDKLNRCIVVQPGVILDDVIQAATEQGLFYPIKTSSSHWCTIGGNIAANAGAASAIKYGVTGDYVMGLEGFFGNGDFFQVGGKCHKDVAGYDIKKLLVGSEGTLAIITKITLKLIPKPAYQQSLWCSFPAFNLAIESLSACLQSAIHFSAAEFLEKACVDAFEKVHGIETQCNTGEAFVLLTIESDSEAGLNLKEAEVANIITARKGTVQQGQEEMYWRIRRGTSEALENAYAHKVSEDITVPPAEIPRFLAEAKRIQESSVFKIVGYGHLGDGNIHTNILNQCLSQADWNDQHHAIVDQVMALCLSCGGTLSGEHGVGLSKKKYMTQAFTPEMLTLMKQLKACFDPQGILNPSKIL